MGCIVIRVLIATVALFGAANAQMQLSWAATEQDSAPQPLKTCKRELAALLLEVAKHTVELKAAPGAHTACKVLGKLLEAEDRLVSYLELKPECQTSSMSLSRVRAAHAESRETRRGCPVREIAGFDSSGL
jgi:hypothetical protein